MGCSLDDLALKRVGIDDLGRIQDGYGRPGTLDVQNWVMKSHDPFSEEDDMDLRRWVALAKDQKLLTTDSIYSDLAKMVRGSVEFLSQLTSHRTPDIPQAPGNTARSCWPLEVISPGRHQTMSRLKRFPFARGSQSPSLPPPLHPISISSLHA
jgi:hypothetical protein